MKRNPRVGCKGSEATHILPTSFRAVSDAMVGRIQRQYSTGFYTQQELANKYDVSASIVSKVCRAAASNIDAAMRNIRSRIKKLKKVG